MGDYSKFYGFNVPAPSDQYSLSHWNENTEKMDAMFKEVELDRGAIHEDLDTLFRGLSNVNVGDRDGVFYKLFLLIYPVGSLYWSKEATNPGGLFGGVWEQRRDVFIFAAGSKNVGATGGAERVTLGASEIPSHTHGAGNLGTASNGAHTHTRGTMDITGQFPIDDRDKGKTSGAFWVSAAASGPDGSGEGNLVSFKASRSWTGATSSAGAHTHSVTGSTASVGSGNSHENMPPYLVRYCFERVGA